jgi:serine/threonine-protein kinase RsbW
MRSAPRATIAAHRFRIGRKLTRSALSIQSAGDAAQFSARMAALAAAFGFAAAFCERHGIAREDALRLKLVIEELFTNTVRHGYRADSDAPIRIALAALPHAMTLVYEDEAPPFDPTACTTASARAAPDAVGSFGLRLLGGIARDLSYARDAGRNRLSLTLPRTRTPR